MTALLPILAVLLVATTDPAPAAPATSAASQVLVDRFMTLIPGAERFDRIDRTADAGELERLTGLNPGRDAEIRALLEDHAGCLSEARNTRTKTMLRTVARQLGDEKLGRLIQFYEREEWRVLERLAGRGEENLSAAERDEFARLMAAYPLDEFRRAMNPFNPAFWQDNPMEAEDQCRAARDAAERRLGLRIGPDPIPVLAE